MEVLLLILIALVLAIISIFKPQWPLLPVAVILLCCAMLIWRRGF